MSRKKIAAAIAAALFLAGVLAAGAGVSHASAGSDMHYHASGEMHFHG